MFWKVKLGPVSTGLGEAEYRSCEEAPNMDRAISQARGEVGQALRNASATAMVFSAIETENPLAAEKLFLETGNFDAYLKGL